MRSPRVVNTNSTNTKFVIIRIHNSCIYRCTRPDDKAETLGLTVLDEPSAKQSDPSVLELHMRVVSKQSSGRSDTVAIGVYSLVVDICIRIYGRAIIILAGQSHISDQNAKF